MCLLKYKIIIIPDLYTTVINVQNSHNVGSMGFSLKQIILIEPVDCDYGTGEVITGVLRRPSTNTLSGYYGFTDKSI